MDSKDNNVHQTFQPSSQEPTQTQILILNGITRTNSNSNTESQWHKKDGITRTNSNSNTESQWHKKDGRFKLSFLITEITSVKYVLP